MLGARKAAVLWALAFFFISPPLFSQESEIAIESKRLPRINSTKSGDKDFMLKQLDGEVEENRRLLAQGKAPALTFYAYRAKKGDTLFALASRFCLRYDSLSVINGITSADDSVEQRRLLIPTADGIFVPLEEDGSKSALEILLQKNRLDLLEDTGLMRYTVDGKKFAFLPGEKFSATERAFFLDSSIRLPVKEYWISSRFGQRDDPFGSSKAQFHRGVDMAVPEGTSVFSCKGGTVLGTGENRVYGKWILIDHGRGMTSFYAHLSQIQGGIETGALVRQGDLIARSGSSGQVTGPHLHFEIRVNGAAVNPEGYGSF